MGRGIQSWMTLLAKSGTTKQKAQSRTRIRHARGRKLRFENCEERSMLATFTVNSELDNIAADGLTTLREAILVANQDSVPDTINFDASLNGKTILLDPLLGQMTITRDLTINGLGRDDLTIDAQGNSQIFEINDGVFGAGAVVQDVKVSGLTLTGGNGGFGGAIEFRDDLTLTNMRLIGNTAALGGALYHTKSPTDTETIDIKLTNVELIDNVATATTGVSGIAGGGAVFVSGAGNVSLDNVIAHGNTAGKDGGVLRVLAGDSLTVKNSKFHTNSAAGDGGAIFAEGTKTLTIESSTFGVDPAIPNSQGNTSGRQGGALYWQGSTSGIDDDVRDVYIYDSLFEGNTALSTGGGLRLEHQRFEKSEIVDTVVRDNHVVGGPGQEKHGGGIDMATTGKLVLLDNVTVESNSAGLWTDTSGGRGGGIHFGQIFDLVTAESVTVRDSRIVDNETSGEGGGIWAQLHSHTTPLVPTLKIEENTVIEDNRANGDGGGLYIDNGDIEGPGNPEDNAGVFELVDSVVTGNRVYVDPQFPEFGSKGGGLYLQSWSTSQLGGKSTILRTTFADNESSGGGGGIYASVSPRAPLTIRDSAIHDNDTYGDGGGLELVIGPGNASLEDRVLLLNTTVAKNTASSGGGIATNGQGTLFAHSTITDNSAGPRRFSPTDLAGSLGEKFTAGGGIYFTGFRDHSEVQLDHVLVAGNNHYPDESGDMNGGSGGETGATGQGTGGNWSPDIGAGHIQPAFADPTTTMDDVLIRYTIIGNVQALLDQTLDDVFVRIHTEQSSDTSTWGGEGITPFGLKIEDIFQLDGAGRPRLADNGGPTKTVQLAYTGEHLALDRGDPAFDPTTLPYDQRLAPFDREYNLVAGDGTDPFFVDADPNDAIDNTNHQIDIGAFEVQPPNVLGDYNLRGTVDLADYGVWRDIVGTTNIPMGVGADGDGDGDVDQLDYEVWKVNFGDTTVNLPIVPGDYNVDGAVNHADYTVWRDTRGAIVDDFTGADGSGNSVVDDADYLIWKRNFAAQPGLAGAGTSINHVVAGAAPKVIDVAISGSQSQHNPYSFADAMQDPGWIAGDQLKTVPVGGADTISITFSEDVFVDASDLQIIGLRTLNQPTLANPTDFAYDQLTHTATWKLSGWTLGDHFLFSLKDTIQDMEGETLDGEWTNPTNITSTSTSVSSFGVGSGDGMAGGSFQFVATLLPGDANLDAVVDLDDYNTVLFNFYIGVVFTDGDFDGDGLTDIDDLNTVLFNTGNDLQNLQIAADLFQDYVIDQLDRAVIEGNLGMSSPTYADGDLNDDGVIDQADLTLFDTIDAAFDAFGLDLRVA